MSFTNGLGNLQQLFGATDVAATSKTAAASKTTGGTLNPDPQNVLPGRLSGDHVSLSAVAGLTAQALSGSDVRSEKVAALQQAIAAGTYHVSSSDVAGKLIDVMMK